MIERQPRAERAAPGMHDEDRTIDPELAERLVDHPRLDVRRRILPSRARAPAMAGTVDQDDAMLLGQEVAERMPHRFEVGARAVQHHDRQAGIARADIDDMEHGTFDLDHPALRRKGALHGDNSGLRDQRQQHQRRHG